MSCVNTISIDGVDYVKASDVESAESLGEIDVSSYFGRYCVVRCRDAGVHAGYVASINGRSVDLVDSRRLWYWKCKKSAFLSGVAQYGITSESKIGAELPLIHLGDMCEVIPCTKEAADSIKKLPEHTP